MSKHEQDRNREEVLRESEERFRRLANSMPQLVWTATPDGRVDYYNERYREFAGIRKVGDNAWQWEPVLHPEDRERTVAAWAESTRTATVYEIEHRVQRANGEFHWYLSRAVPALDEECRVIKWYGTATDVHRRKMAEQQVRELNETLEARVARRTAELAKAYADLEAFAYSIAHDLRAPLRHMTNLLTLLERSIRGVRSDTEDHLDGLKSASQRMTALIDELLDTHDRRKAG